MGKSGLICKSGVSLDYLVPEIWFALGSVVTLRDTLIDNKSVTVTAARENRIRGLHPKGMAVDLRIRDMTPIQVQRLYQALRKHLDPYGFDTVLEADHLHIEYDPKAGEILWEKTD